MRKLIAVLIIAIMLTACGGQLTVTDVTTATVETTVGDAHQSVPPETTTVGDAHQSVPTETTTAESTATTEPPVTTPPKPPTEEEILAEYVQDICHLGVQFPFFTDINKVDIYTLIRRYMRENDDYSYGEEDRFANHKDHHRYSQDELEQLLGHETWDDGRGVTPARLESWVRERFNPNFRIDSYDYKNTNAVDSQVMWNRVSWDGERGKLVLITRAIGLHAWNWVEITDIQKVGDIYNVFAFLQLLLEDGERPKPPEYIHITLTKKADGNFNIISKQLAGSQPQWVKDFIKFMDKLESSDIDTIYKAFHEYEVEKLEWCSGCIESDRTICNKQILIHAYLVYEKALKVFKQGGLQ